MKKSDRELTSAFQCLESRYLVQNLIIPYPQEGEENRLQVFFLKIINIRESLLRKFTEVKEVSHRRNRLRKQLTTKTGALEIRGQGRERQRDGEMERLEGRDRERNIDLLFTYLCFQWLTLVCALTGD